MTGVGCYVHPPSVSSRPCFAVCDSDEVPQLGVFDFAVKNEAIKRWSR